ncbi:winged helix-turn-helix transcriptional regulator [Candidatus Dojkabacteria bacterium]|nr:winged helix-turn-helix transcriptional regulator [Candidatus Dojkabacteria bacterium]
MVKTFIYTPSESLRKIIFNQLELVSTPIEIKPEAYIPTVEGIFIIDMRTNLSEKIIRRINTQSYILGIYGTMISQNTTGSRFDSILSEKFYLPFHMDLFFQKILFYKTQLNKRRFNQILGAQISLNPSLNLLTVKDKVINFTQLEYSILEYILFNEDRPVTKLELLTQIKSTRGYISTACLHVTVSKIRKKLKANNIPITINGLYRRGYQCDLKNIKSDPYPLPLPFSSCSSA